MFNEIDIMLLLKLQILCICLILSLISIYYFLAVNLIKQSHQFAKEKGLLNDRLIKKWIKENRFNLQEHIE